MNSNKKTYIFSLVALAFFVLALIGYAKVSTQDDVSKIEQSVFRVQASSVTDVSDDRRLVGFADNVFIGRVQEQLETHSPDNIFPETLFSVEVIKNIKGELTGTVIVNQQGGYSEEDKVIYLFEDDTLLEVGKIYLFATLVGGNDKWKEWHTLIPVYGDIPIEKEENIGVYVEKYELAKREQIPFEFPDEKTP